MIVQPSRLILYENDAARKPVFVKDQTQHGVHDDALLCRDCATRRPDGVDDLAFDRLRNDAAHKPVSFLLEAPGPFKVLRLILYENGLAGGIAFVKDQT